LTWSRRLKSLFNRASLSKLSQVVIASMSLLAGSVSFAQSQALAEVDPAIKDAIYQQLKAARPDFEYSEPSFTPFKGLYKVQVVRGPILYVSADGKNAVQIEGEPYDVSPAGFMPWSNPYEAQVARTALSKIASKDMIVYPAKGKTKAHIYAFTDVHCGFCRKLHMEIPKLNAAGVEVRYLAFPRAGEVSESSDLLARAFCAKDRQHALTNLKAMAGLQSSVSFMERKAREEGKSSDASAMSLKEAKAELNKYEKELAQGDYGQICADHPIKRHMQLVFAFGIRGTRAIYLENGTKVSGYRSADDLIKMLKI